MNTDSTVADLRNIISNALNPDANVVIERDGEVLLPVNVYTNEFGDIIVEVE
jgi:hypothetical protein